MNPGWSAADTAAGFGRRDAHAAEERAQRDFNAVAETSHHPLFIQRNDLHLRVREILRQRYGLTVEVVARGSMAMVEGDTTGQDFLWPGSEVAIERYWARGGKLERADTVFASPLVLYSWDVVTDSLERAGVAKRQGDSHYTVDLPRLIRLSDEGKTWKDLGLPQLHGRISVFTADPNKTNGGAMFATSKSEQAHFGYVQAELKY